MADHSTTSNGEETDGSNPMKHRKENTVTVKSTSTTSPSAPLLPLEATHLPQHLWSEVEQCPPAPGGRNSLILWCDLPVTIALSLDLKSQQKPSWSTWSKMLLTCPFKFQAKHSSALPVRAGSGDPSIFWTPPIFPCSLVLTIYLDGQAVRGMVDMGVDVTILTETERKTF